MSLNLRLIEFEKSCGSIDNGFQNTGRVTILDTGGLQHSRKTIGHKNEMNSV